MRDGPDVRSSQRRESVARADVPAGRDRQANCAMALPIVHSFGIGELSRRALVLGGYLTDGGRLFRVVSRFEGDGEIVLVGLEDCSTFEVKALLPRELRAMRLRAVRRVTTTGNTTSPKNDIATTLTPHRRRSLVRRDVSPD